MHGKIKVPQRRNFSTMLFEKKCKRDQNSLIFIDENHTPLPPQAVFAFSDIKAMYPNVDIEEGLEEIKTKLEIKEISSNTC